MAKEAVNVLHGLKYVQKHVKLVLLFIGVSSIFDHFSPYHALSLKL